MPLIEGMTIRTTDRSSASRLIVSEGFSPAEPWLTDPNLPVLFQYRFGFPAMQAVQVPKGCAVAVGPQAVDFETGKRKTTLTFANGTNAYAGLAPYNFCQKIDDRFLGNEPTIVRGMYVELPYIPNADDCALVRYGAVHGDINIGDILAPSLALGNLGHLAPWSVDRGFGQIVGQVLGIENDQEPFGFFKWVMWDETARKQDNITPPFTQGALPTDVGYQYDPAYRDGMIPVYTDGGYQSPYTLQPKGIPGLTDGWAKSQTTQVIEAVVPPILVGGAFYVNLGFKNVIPESVEVTVAGVPVDPATFTLNAKTGALVYTSPVETIAPEPMVVNFRATFYGTPPGWDYLGNAGVVRILLR